MILLLDAHALVWWLDHDTTLLPAAQSAIRDPSNDVLVSAATIWELAIKRAAGKIRLPGDLTDALDRVGISSTPVLAADGEAAAALPMHHRDPFDRMVIAQARRIGAVVVTRDEAFARYKVDVLPA